MTGLVCIGTRVEWIGWYGERVRLDFDTPEQAARAAERRARAAQ